MQKPIKEELTDLTEHLINTQETNIRHSPTPSIEELQEVLCKIILAGSNKLTSAMLGTLRNAIINCVNRVLKTNLNKLDLQETINTILRPIVRSLTAKQTRITASSSDLLLLLKPLTMDHANKKVCIIEKYTKANLHRISEHLFNIDPRVRKNIIRLLEPFQTESVGDIEINLLFRNLSRTDPSASVRREAVKRMILSKTDCPKCLDSKEENKNLKHTENKSYNSLVSAVNNESLSVRTTAMSRLNEISIKHLSFLRRQTLLKRCFTERYFDAKTMLVSAVKSEYTYLEIVEDFCDVSIDFITRSDIANNTRNTLFNNVSDREGEDLFLEGIQVNLPELIYSNTTQHLTDLLFEIFQEREFELVKGSSFNELFLLRVFNEYLWKNEKELVLPDSFLICEEVLEICQLKSLTNTGSNKNKENKEEEIAEEDFCLKTLRSLELFKIAHFYKSYDSEAKKNLIKSLRSLLAHHCNIFYMRKCPSKLRLYSNFVYLLFTHLVSLIYKWDSNYLIMKVVGKFISSSSYNMALLNLFRVVFEVYVFNKHSLNINSNKSGGNKKFTELEELVFAIFDEGVRPFLERKIQQKNLSKNPNENIKTDGIKNEKMNKREYGLPVMLKRIKFPQLATNINNNINSINKKEEEKSIKEINREINYNLLLHCYFLYDPSDTSILSLKQQTDLYLNNQVCLKDLRKCFELKSENIGLACKILMKEAVKSCNNIMRDSMDSENRESQEGEFIYELLHFLMEKYINIGYKDMYSSNNEKLPDSENNNNNAVNIMHVFWCEYLKITTVNLHILPVFTHYIHINTNMCLQKNSSKTIIDLNISYSNILDVLLFYMIYWLTLGPDVCVKCVKEVSLICLTHFSSPDSLSDSKNIEREKGDSIEELQELLKERNLKNKKTYSEKISIGEVLVKTSDGLKLKVMQIVGNKLARQIDGDGFSKLYFEISRRDDGRVSEKLMEIVSEYLF